MSDKLTKDTARQKFRSSVNIKDISATEMHPDYDYKWVDLQFTEGLKRVDRYIDKGWEVIYSKDKPKDDRKNIASQDGKEADLRTSPVTRTTRGGNTQIYMKVLKETRIKNGLESAARDKARYQAQQKCKVTETMKGTKITSEIDLTRPEIGE